MNKGKICLLTLLVALVMVLAFLMVRPSTSQKNVLNGEVTDPTENALFPSVTESRIDTSEAEASVSVKPTIGQNMDQEQDLLQQQEQHDQKDPYLETNVQPIGDETLPPDVDVMMGVEKDDELEGIDNLTSDSSSGSTQISKPTEPKPTETTAPIKPSSGSSTDPLSDNYDLTTLTYEGYITMTGEQQQAVIDWFSTPDEFIKWFNLVEARYKEAHPDIEIGSDGVVDLS